MKSLSAGHLAGRKTYLRTEEGHQRVSFPPLEISSFLHFCAEQEVSALASAWSSFSLQGGGVSSYFGAKGPLVSLRSLCFGLTALAGHFLISRPSYVLWKEIRSSQRAQGSGWERQAELLLPLGEVSYCMPQVHLALLPQLLRIPFSSPRGPLSVCLFVRHRLLHSNIIR